jgi:hypothetical protein
MKSDRELSARVEKYVKDNLLMYQDGRRLNPAEIEAHFEITRRIEGEVEQRRAAIDSIPEPSWLATTDAASKTHYAIVMKIAAESKSPELRQQALNYLLKQNDLTTLDIQ